MISSENTFLTTAEDDFPMRSSSFEGPLRYFTGHPVHAFAEGQNFHLRSNLGLLRFSTGTTTVYSARQFTSKDSLHILARKRQDCDAFLAMAICSAEDFKVFEKFHDLDVKLRAIRVYATMTDKQREELLRQMKVKYPDEGPADTSRVISLAHKKLKFDLCADSFSPRDRRHIRNLFLESSNKNKNDIKLSYLLNIDPCPPPLPSLPEETFIHEMGKTVFALDDVIKQLAEKIQAHQPVLLEGGSGVCKRLVTALAQTLSLPWAEVDLASASNSLDLLGTDSTYDKAGPGKFAEGMHSSGTSRMLFHLRHMDRVNTEENKESSCLDALLHVLSPGKSFEDHFLESPISTEHTVFIATAASAAAVPEELRKLFHVIKLPEYTCDELEIIARNVFLPPIMEEAGAKIDAVLFPTETLRHIADRYCEDYSAGRMKQHLHSLIHEVIQKQSAGSLPTPYSVDCDLVESCLGRNTDELDSRLIVHRNREKYDPTVLKKLSELSAQLKNTRLSMDERRILQERFALIAGLYPRFDAANFNLKVFYDTIRSTHDYMDTVADIIAGEFLCASKTPPRLFLSGPPGTGKTSVVQSLAAAVGWPVLRIPCNDPETGSLRSKIIRGLSKQGTAVLLQLDELDKASLSVANDLLDSNCSISIPELDLTLDLSHLIIIATGNNAAAVAQACPALANRLIHIPLPGYTTAEKAVITRRHIIPRLEESFGTIDMTDHTLDFLLQHYCRTPGIRDVEQTLHGILRKKALLSAQENTGNIFTSVTKADILTALGTPPLLRGNFPGRVAPGVVRGLAVSADTGEGVSLSVETLLTPNLPGIRTTGLAETCAKESVELCRSFLASYYPKQFQSDGIHVHFGEAAVPTDGPSAGASLVVSMMSAMLGKAVPGEIAFTGEIDLHGNIFKVGSIRAKVQAACLSGCTRVFIPWQNLPELDVKEFAIEIIPVCHVGEILTDIFASKLPSGIPVRPAV